jgi:hypothetical protein
MPHIKIKDVSRIRKELGLTHMVIYGITPDLKHHVATHGKSFIDAHEAASAGNALKGALGWPKNLRSSKPLERVCENCESWERGYHRPGNPIPDPWPGKCMHEPQPISRNDKDIACSKFQPDC